MPFLRAAAPGANKAPSSSSTSPKDTSEAFTSPGVIEIEPQANAKAPPKGLSRIPLVRKIANALVDSAVVELTRVHVEQPTDDAALTAAAGLRITEIGLGPLVVTAKLKFKGHAELCWPADDDTEQKDGHPGAKKDQVRAGRVIGSARIDDIRLASSGPAALSGKTRLCIQQTSDDDVELGRFAREILAAPTDQSRAVILRAEGVSVKAYGITIAGLTLQKRLTLGGLGGLGGALSFGAGTSDGFQDASGSKRKHLVAPPVTLKPKRSGFLSSRSRKESDRSSATAATQSGEADPTVSVLMTQGLDIIGGHAEEGILISTSVNLQVSRPSAKQPQMSVDLGELRLSLNVPLAGDALVCVGSLVLRDTRIRIGPNKVEAHGAVRVSSNIVPGSPEARACAGLFSALLQNEPIEVIALGEAHNHASGGVSETQWLARALAGVRVRAILPPLGDKARIIDGAQLKAEFELASKTAQASLSVVDGRTSRSNSQSSSRSAEEKLYVRATIRNSFNVACRIRRINVMAMESDPEDPNEPLQLGQVVTPEGWEGIDMPALQSTPVTLPLELNRDAAPLISILRTSAKRSGVDLGKSFTRVLDLAQGRPPAAQNEEADDGPQEDFAQIVTRAFANLTVQAAIDVSDIVVGDYVVPGGIQFTQPALGITISTATAGLIVPRVGAPVVEKLVAEGQIAIGAIDVHEISESGMAATASLTLSNFGPIAAKITTEGGSPLRWVDGERKGEIAALFFLNQPLYVEPNKTRPQTCDVRIVPAKAQGTASSESFSEFLSALLNREESRWLFEAKDARVLAGGVEFFPTISKEVVLKGFGGFPDLVTDKFDIVGEDVLPHALSARLGLRANTTVLGFRASVTLQNTSDISLYIGHLEGDVLLGDVAIGHLTAHDVNLVRGKPCALKATGYIFESADPKVLGNLASELLANQWVRVKIRGRSATVSRQPQRLTVDERPSKPNRSLSSRSMASSVSRDEGYSIGWLDSALQHLLLDVSVKHVQHEVVQRIELEKLEASFPRGAAPTIGIGGLLVKYEVPLPIDVAIERVSADVEIIFDDIVVGTGTARDSQVLEAQEKAGSRRRKDSRSDSEVEYATGTLRLSLAHFELKTDSEAFAAMIDHVFSCEESDRISLRGEAHVSAKTALGTLPCHVDLGQAHKLRIKGMRSLATSPTDYTGLQVVDATPERLKVTFDLFLNNPSKNVVFSLPDSGLSFAAFYRGAYVGRAYVGGDSGPFQLDSGPCAFKGVSFLYEPRESEEKAVRQLPANFLSGTVTTLEIRGDDESTDLAALRPALSSLRLTFDLKPLVDRMLIASIEITLGAKILTANAVECEFVISNPLLVPIDLTSLSFVANYRGKPFGSASMTWPEGSALRVMPGEGPHSPGHSSGQCLVRLGQRLDQLVKAFLKERGQIYVQVDLSAGVEMGGYRIPVFEYTQERLPLNIRNLQSVSKLLWALPG